MTASPAAQAPLAAPILDCRDLHAGYGKKETLHGLDMELKPGEVLVVLGHNGAGKTTAMRAIFGLNRPTKGTVHYEGKDITGRMPGDNVRDGIAFVPQGHGIFRRLNVRDNLELGAFAIKDRSAIPANIKAIYDLFPILQERREQIAGTMSGGQQQMLAIGMALMHNPRVLILDEPSIGLAPNLVDRVMQAIRKVNQDFGTSIVIVEQNVRAGLAIADRTVIVKTGSKVYDGSPEPLHDHIELMKYF
jgi:branched-chain amino acid transport system ATP-binding protein